MPKRKRSSAGANRRWMSSEEAIAHIMRSTGCDIHEAREQLAEAIKDGKINWRQDTEPAPNPPWLDGKEAARLFQEEPEKVMIPFSEMLKHCTWPELLAELRSGRLRAFPMSESVMLHMYLSNYIDPEHYAVTGTALLDWMEHPDTPPALLRKILPRSWQQ